jgi:hypothetical protein
MKIEVNLSGKMEIEMDGDTVKGVRVKLDQTNEPLQVSLFQTTRTRTSERPTAVQVAAYFKETYNVEFPRCKDEADKFWRFYDSKGWKVGRNPMVNWKSAAGNWITSSKVETKTNDTDF